MELLFRNLIDHTPMNWICRVNPETTSCYGQRKYDFDIWEEICWHIDLQFDELCPKLIVRYFEYRTLNLFCLNSTISYSFLLPEPMVNNIYMCYCEFRWCCKTVTNTWQLHLYHAIDTTALHLNYSIAHVEIRGMENNNPFVLPG